MSQQKGVLVLFNKEEKKYYTYKVELTNGHHLKVFGDGEHLLKDTIYRVEK